VGLVLLDPDLVDAEALGQEVGGGRLDVAATHGRTVPVPDVTTAGLASRPTVHQNQTERSVFFCDTRHIGSNP
jgi:hypothetical protein